MSVYLCMNNFSTIHLLNLDLVFTISNTSCSRRLLKLIHMCIVEPLSKKFKLVLGSYLDITYYIFSFRCFQSKLLSLSEFNMLYITQIYVKHHNKCVSRYLFLFDCIFFRLTMWCALLDNMDRTVTLHYWWTPMRA